MLINEISLILLVIVNASKYMGYIVFTYTKKWIVAVSILSVDKPIYFMDLVLLMI